MVIIFWEGWIIIVRSADLIDFCRRFSFVKCVCFVSRPMKIVTFRWTEDDSQTLVVDFSGKRHISKKRGNRRGFRRTELQQQ